MRKTPSTTKVKRTDDSLKWKLVLLDMPCGGRVNYCMGFKNRLTNNAFDMQMRKVPPVLRVSLFLFEGTS